MYGQHPNKPDPRPKRRKDRDNPYEIFTVGIGTDAHITISDSEMVILLNTVWRSAGSCFCLLTSLNWMICPI